MIICSYKDYKMIKDRYPKRKVEPLSYVQPGQFMVVRRDNKGLFIVMIKDLDITTGGRKG